MAGLGQEILKRHIHSEQGVPVSLDWANYCPYQLLIHTQYHEGRNQITLEGPVRHPVVQVHVHVHTHTHTLAGPSQ